MVTETVVVWQGKQRLTSYRAGGGAQQPGAAHAVERLHELTPYGMVLAGLGACTALVVNTYAEHHGLPVEAVVVTATYQRSDGEDCEQCEPPATPEEQILLSVAFEGELSQPQREKLLAIAARCPLHQLFAGGVAVRTQPA